MEFEKKPRYMYCLGIEMEFEKKNWAYVLSEHRNGILKKSLDKCFLLAYKWNFKKSLGICFV